MNAHQKKEGFTNMVVEQKIIYVTSVSYVAGEKYTSGLLSNTGSSVSGILLE